MDDLEKRVRDKFSEMFEKDKTIEEVYKKIRQGTATYEDAHKFSLAIGEMLETVFADMVDQIPEGADLMEIADSIVDKALKQNFRLSSLVCETIQDELNSMARIGLKAIEPTIDLGRVNAIKEAFVVSETPEAMKVALGQDVKTFAQAVVDDWVRSNADFQKQSGLNPIIARKWSGRYSSHDTKHTDWCHELEGVWEYGEHPSRVFARHQGCTCTVLYYPSKDVQGRITALAKGEKDTDQVLWNTGEIFSNSRSAVLRRRRQMYGKEEARKILNEEWKGGLNGNAERHFK
jgi:hypothetical protein